MKTKKEYSIQKIVIFTMVAVFILGNYVIRTTINPEESKELYSQIQFYFLALWFLTGDFSWILSEFIKGKLYEKRKPTIVVGIYALALVSLWISVFLGISTESLLILTMVLVVYGMYPHRLNAKHLKELEKNKK